MTVQAPQLVTSRQAGELLDVPPKRTAKWVEDGKVRAVGLLPGRSRGGRGVPTFRLEDFRPLAAAYHDRHDTSTRDGREACARTSSVGG